MRNIATLADAGWRVIVPDLPGFGASAKPPEGGDADAVAPWIESGLDELLGGAPCDIAAFSFGGIVASMLVDGASTAGAATGAGGGAGAVRGAGVATRTALVDAPAARRSTAMRCTGITSVG